MPTILTVNRHQTTNGSVVYDYRDSIVTHEDGSSTVTFHGQRKGALDKYVLPGAVVISRT